MRRINYLSDIKLLESAPAETTDFIYHYTTDGNECYDVSLALGNCKKVQNPEGEWVLIITLDNHKLPVGRLKCRREMRYGDTDFPDDIWNAVTEYQYDILLVDGESDPIGEEEVIGYMPIFRGEKGEKGDGYELTEDDVEHIVEIVTERVDLSDYYTKEEVDEKLAEQSTEIDNIKNVDITRLDTRLNGFEKVLEDERQYVKYYLTDEIKKKQDKILGFSQDGNVTEIKPNDTTQNKGVVIASTMGAALEYVDEGETKHSLRVFPTGVFADGKEVATKEDFKTINGESILGEGDIEIKGGGEEPYFIPSSHLTQDERRDYIFRLPQEDIDYIIEHKPNNIVVNYYETNNIELSLYGYSGEIAYDLVYCCIQSPFQSAPIKCTLIASTTVRRCGFYLEQWSNDNIKNDAGYLIESNLKTVNGESIVGEGDIEATYDDTEIRNKVGNAVELAEEALNQVKELKFYKTPNLTIFGNPEIKEGQVSNLSDVNYMQFPFLVNFNSKPWVIEFNFTTPNATGVLPQQNLIDSNFGLAVAIRNNHLVIAVSSNGISWATEYTCNDVTIGSEETHNVIISADGEIIAVWIDHHRCEFSFIGFPATKQTLIGRGVQVGKAFTGSINLNYAKLFIGGELVWQGMDSVGIASRAAVDLSNIDEYGHTVIKDDAYETLTENIKTINNESIIGKGNIDISGGVELNYYSEDDSSANIIVGGDEDVNKSSFKVSNNSIFLDSRGENRYSYVSFGDSYFGCGIEDNYDKSFESRITNNSDGLLITTQNDKYDGYGQVNSRFEYSDGVLKNYRSNSYQYNNGFYYIDYNKTIEWNFGHKFSYDMSIGEHYREIEGPDDYNINTNLNFEISPNANIGLHFNLTNYNGNDDTETNISFDVNRNGIKYNDAPVAVLWSGSEEDYNNLTDEEKAKYTLFLIEE